MTPLFFVRGGFVYTYYQQLYNAGQDAYYWSSRAYSNTGSAYSLYFSTSVYPSDSGNSRYYGSSLRCLIPTT